MLDLHALAGGVPFRLILEDRPLVVERSKSYAVWRREGDGGPAVVATDHIELRNCRTIIGSYPNAVYRAEFSWCEGMFHRVWR